MRTLKVWWPSRQRLDCSIILGPQTFHLILVNKIATKYLLLNQDLSSIINTPTRLLAQDGDIPETPKIPATVDGS
jgi:hypothetical protein